jgi:hypothetical protein
MVRSTKDLLLSWTKSTVDVRMYRGLHLLMGRGININSRRPVGGNGAVYNESTPQDPFVAS